MSTRRVAVMAAFAAAALMAAPTVGAAGLTEAGELEAARANARAGGPLSERDKELLERWGCTTGTKSQFCRDREYRQSGMTKKRTRKH